MFPNNSSIDLNIKKLLATCHKETQTNNVSLTDTGTATGSRNVDTSDKGSLKVFEFSELVQDPKHPREITIIKDVYAEEIHDHNSPTGSASNDAIANRYTYCREVIKPYLKDYPKDCPVSDDQLIRDALDAAHEDFPDYEPCFEGYDGSPKGSSEGGGKDKAGSPDKDSVLHYFGIKDKTKSPDTQESALSHFGIKDDHSSKSSISKKDKSTSKSSTCIKKDKKSPSKTSLTKDKSSTSNNLRSNMDPDKACPPAAPKVRDYRCPKKSKCPPSLEPCFDPDDPPPGPPSACKNPPQAGKSPCKSTPSAGSVGPCEDKPIPKKEKSCEQPKNDMQQASIKSVFAKDSVTAPPEERKKTMMEAHSETIATIKTAVEDFFGKVYQTTKEAVTVIKTESAKHLGRMTATKSGGSSTDLIPQKVHENQSSETLTSFKFFKDNPEKQGQENDQGDENLKKAGQAIGKIFATVDSTISMLSNQIDLEKMSSLVKFESKDKSSPYDKVEGREEEPVSTSTSLPSSVFTAIKSKIVSMFSEGESDPKELSRKSSADTTSSESRQSVSLKPSKKRF